MTEKTDSKEQQKKAIKKISELETITEKLSNGEAVNVTTLTRIKTLCRETRDSQLFAFFIAKKVLNRVKNGKLPITKKEEIHKRLMSQGVRALHQAIAHPKSKKHEVQLRKSKETMYDEQCEFKHTRWAEVRQVHDWNLLLIEKAIECYLSYDIFTARYHSYELARCYAEKYDAHYPEGLVPKSLPFVQDIVCFWKKQYEVDSPQMVKKLA